MKKCILLFGLVALMSACSMNIKTDAVSTSDSISVSIQDSCAVDSLVVDSIAVDSVAL